MLFNLNFILLNLAGLKCCNVYSDFCDTMETSEDHHWFSDQPVVRRAKREEMGGTEGSNITKQQMASRVSQILDNLFGGGYNKQFRPGQYTVMNSDGILCIVQERGRNPLKLRSTLLSGKKTLQKTNNAIFSDSSLRSMGPIDETQERYTLDCYFRSGNHCCDCKLCPEICYKYLQAVLV